MLVYCSLWTLRKRGRGQACRRRSSLHCPISFVEYSALAVFGRYSDPSVHHEMGRGSSTRCRSCTNDIAAVMMVGVPTDKVGHPRLFVKLGAFKGFFPTIICYTHAHSPTMYTHVVSFHSDRVIPPTISHSIAEILGFMYIPQHHVSRAMHIIRLFKTSFYLGKQHRTTC